MYTIVMSIPVAQLDGQRMTLPDALARDLLTHHRYEQDLRVIVPQAEMPEHVSSGTTLDLRAHPGLSFRLLPWNGHRNTWPMAYPSIRRVLIEEAKTADVWHTGCSRSVWDLSTVAHGVGRRHARRVRIFSMDSDPAEMLIASRGLGLLVGPWVRWALRRRVRSSNGTIFIGKGPIEKYGQYARQFVTADAVWLEEGELASEEEVAAKFHAPGPARLIVPSRFTAWKGVDDVIEAVARLRTRLDRFSVDLIGDGPLKPRLISMVARMNLGSTIRFLSPVPYGKPFLRLLRTYHAVLVPTRGLEEARVVFDAAASGCILVHSRTSTLEAALRRLRVRWGHVPGDPVSLSAAIGDALGRREEWKDAALEGVRFMRGRTIDSMHRERAEFVARLVEASRSSRRRSDRV